MFDPENSPFLEVDTVTKSSEACRCIILWVKAMDKFHNINKKVKPKKKKLAEA